ncbi:uncharacterized protein TNCV_7661 [Trichonephila clavipes]|nr:uncharacterized protein TNCV_7661 [Trichonephila clavipes]
MPVVSDPCSCQPDCLVCGWREEPPHDCSIHVLLESMVFQERMLNGEPTEAKLEEILKNAKEYLPIAMHMTEENSREYKSLTAFLCNSFTVSASSRVIMWFKILLPHQHYPSAAMVGKDGKLYFRLVDVGALLGRSKVFKFAKRFDNLVIQGKDVLPAYKQYPIMMQSLNAGSALVENPSILFVESYKTSPVLHVQDSPVPNSILRLSLPERPAEPERISTPSAQRPERIPNPPVEPERPAKPLRISPAEPQRMPSPPAEPKKMPPAEPERPSMEMVDPSVSVNTVEVTSPLITRCDKGTQTIFPYLHVKRLDLVKRRMEQIQANKRLKQEPSEVSNKIFFECLEIILS